MAAPCSLLTVVTICLLAAEAFLTVIDAQQILVNPANPGFPQPLPTPRSISKCNSDVMSAIKRNFWNVYGVPRNIIINSINNGKEIVWKTTSGYYSDQPPASCVYSYFFQQYFVVFKVSANGYSTSSDTINAIEVDGALYDPASEILRVIIRSYKGVSLVYTCSLAAGALDGPAAGIVKYKEVNSDLNFAYFQAPALMASVGIYLADEYALTC